MFVILLRFSGDRSRVGKLMEGHKAWIRRGFDDGVFLLVGSLQPNLGGAVMAQDASRADIEHRVNADPFVAEGIVTAEILEVSPVQSDPRLAFLLPESRT